MSKVEEFLELGKTERNSYRATKIFSAVLRLEPDNVEALLLRGESYLRFGEYNWEKYAAEDFEKVIELDPTNATAYFKLGKALCKFYNDEALAGAVKNYSKAIELGMNAYFERGEIHVRLKNYLAAIDDFTQAIELGNYAYVSRGKVFATLENYSAALDDFTRAIELEPTNIKAYSERGKIYEALNNFDAALSDFKKTVDLDSIDDNLKGRCLDCRFLINFCKRTGKFDEELAVIPDDALIFFARGLDFSCEENFKAAAENFSRAIECDPTQARFYFELGSAYLELENYSAALESYNKALELKPDNHNIYSARAVCYQKLGDVEKADEDSFRSMFLELTKDFEREPTAKNFYLRGFNCKLQRRYVEAIDDFTRTIALDKNHKDAYTERGECYFKLKNYAAAAEDFSKAIEFLAPDDNFYGSLMICLMCGKSFFKIKNFDAARNCFKKFLELVDLNPDDKYFYDDNRNYSTETAIQQCEEIMTLLPDNHKLFCFRGCLQKNLDEYESALEDFTRAIELAPTDARYRNVRGKFFIGMGEYESAIKDFTQAIELDPNNTAAYYLRGFCREKSGDEEKSQDDFEKYDELKRLDDLREEAERFSGLIEREPYDCYHFSARAEKYFELQEYEKALADLNVAIELNPSDSQLYERRKEIYEKLF